MLRFPTLPLLTLAMAALAVAPAPSPMARADSTPAMRIYAVLPDGYVSGDLDEAVALINLGDTPQNIGGFVVSDGEGSVVLPALQVQPGRIVWLSRSASAFRDSFALFPDVEYGVDSDASVPNASGVAPVFANTGDEVFLRSADATLIDSLAYGDGLTAPGWVGPRLQFYRGASFALEGQLLFRKLDPLTGRPVADTDTLHDWAQDPDDKLDGRKVRYPGWDWEQFSTPAGAAVVTDTAKITYVVAPDASYAATADLFARATRSISIEVYSLKQADLADLLAMRASQGISVSVLLEGAPVGGLPDQQRWAAQQIDAAGGSVCYLVNGAAVGVHDRYTYQHAKIAVVDGRVALTGSENLNPSGMPSDSFADGTAGTRGAFLITDAPSVVARAQAIIAADGERRHRDVRCYSPSDTVYGPPPLGFTPDRSSGGSVYTPLFTTPFSASGTFAFEIVQSPETSLRSQGGIVGMLRRAGDGDTVFVEQLYENQHWGPSAANATTDPNVRLEEELAAARRGAQVRLLLDGAFAEPSDPRDNTATCAYVQAIAVAEHLDVQCRIANPTGAGIHNKMILVRADGHGAVLTSSINGSENSAKANREIGVIVRTDAGYDYLAQVFWKDWGLASTPEQRVYLPLVVSEP